MLGWSSRLLHTRPPDWCLWVVQRALWQSDFGRSVWVPGGILLPESKGLCSWYLRLGSRSCPSSRPLSGFLDSMRTLPRYWLHPLLCWLERTDSRTAVQSWPRIKWEKHRCSLPGKRGFRTTWRPFHPWKKQESRGFFPCCNWTALRPGANTAYRS